MNMEQDGVFGGIRGFSSRLMILFFAGLSREARDALSKEVEEMEVLALSQR